MSFAALALLNNEQIIQQLTTIPGIGDWTVQMLLIFCLQRPHVLPLEDLIIRRAMQWLYSLEDQRGRLFRRQLQQFASQQVPCRYLWHWYSQLSLTN